jgi:protein pelota
VRLVRWDAKSGECRVRLETPSDLWRLSRLVHPGELVGASTTRRDPQAPAEITAAERTRRRVWLTVRTEAVEFHDFSQHVRVSGPIVEGPFDIGRHHTLDIDVGDEVAIYKSTLSPADRTILDEGTHHRGDPSILIASVDWGDSSLVRLRGRALEPVVDLRRTIAGKQYAPGQGNRDRDSYLKELEGLLRREGKEATSIALAGPGFLKEELAHRIAESDPALRRRILIYSTGASGRVGVDELLRSGRAAEALQGAAAAEEAALVEKLVEGLSSGTRSAVGLEEVHDAVESGAVETLLCSESRLHEGEVSAILERARADQAHLFIVRDDDAPGRRLKGLGGIGAILRYDWRSPRATTGSPGPPRAGPRSGASNP